MRSRLPNVRFPLLIEHQNYSDHIPNSRKVQANSANYFAHGFTPYTVSCIVAGVPGGVEGRAPVTHGYIKKNEKELVTLRPLGDILSAWPKCRKK
jgi:hypothetical protein